MYLDSVAATALRHFAYAESMVSRYLRQLSSGLRINSAADDPAGFAISERMRGQVRGLRMASRNAQDAISLIQTAEGAVGVIGDVLQRMRELSVEAATGTLTQAERDALEHEFAESLATIEGIARTTEFNTLRLLDGSFTGKSFQIGANPGQTLELSIPSMLPDDLGLTGLTLDSADSATDALARLSQVIDHVSLDRANLGAVENRLTFTISNLETTAENLQAAESRIRDADLAEAMLGYAKWQLQAQVSAWVLAQINVQREVVLQLLL